MSWRACCSGVSGTDDSPGVKREHSSRLPAKAAIQPYPRDGRDEGERAQVRTESLILSQSVSPGFTWKPKVQKWLSKVKT